MVCSVWQFDLTKAGAVNKGKLLDFFNLCVRNVHFHQQFTIVTGMRPQHLEVTRQPFFLQFQ